MGGKWKIHRSDHLSWEFTQYAEKTSGHGVLVVTIKSRNMFRKEFLARIPGIHNSSARGGFGHDLDFVCPIQGLSLSAYDCYMVMTQRAGLHGRDWGLLIECMSCKENDRGKITWTWAEDPAKRITEVLVTGD